MLVVNIIDYVSALWKVEDGAEVIIEKGVITNAATD